jgi:16S rRNA (guanine966-N2)-methyltransferase
MARPRPSGPNRARPAAAADADAAAAAPRIIGGSLRGRRLEFVPAGPTRPMKERVRETLFDLLGTSVRGGLAIDLFAGTGALGFEAVSRGAARAILAERHFPTADALGRNARALGIESQVEVRPGDVLLWARRLPPLPADLPWIVFVSPPWSFFTERQEELLGLVATLTRAAPAGSTIVVEADVDFDRALLPEEPGGWDTRTSPPAVLHMHVKPGT